MPINEKILPFLFFLFSFLSLLVRSPHGVMGRSIHPSNKIFDLQEKYVRKYKYYISFYEAKMYGITYTKQSFLFVEYVSQ